MQRARSITNYKNTIRGVKFKHRATKNIETHLRRSDWCRSSISSVVCYVISARVLFLVAFEMQYDTLRQMSQTDTRHDARLVTSKKNREYFKHILMTSEL